MQNTIRFSRFHLVLALLACSVPLRAQNMDSPTSHFLDPQNGLTESELVTRALTNNPALAAQRQTIESAKGAVTQAHLRANPSLAVGGLKEVNGDDNRFNVEAEVPLELFGRRARRTEVAAQKLNSTRETVSDNGRLLTGEVRMRFADTLAAVRNLEFVEQLLSVNREFLTLMEDRVREGAVPVLDADEVRVEANRIESIRIDYQAKAEIALLALKEAVGMPPDESLSLKGDLAQPVIALDRSQLLQLALDHRPDLAAKRAVEMMAAAAERQQQMEARPDVSLSAGYERPNSGFSFSAFDAGGNLQPI